MVFRKIKKKLWNRMRMSLGGLYDRKTDEIPTIKARRFMYKVFGEHTTDDRNKLMKHIYEIDLDGKGSVKTNSFVNVCLFR